MSHLEGGREKSSPLLEKILRDGGVMVQLPDGQAGHAVLELAYEETLEMAEAPSKKIKPKDAVEQAKTGGIQKIEKSTRHKSVFIRNKDRAFAAAFPNTDRFARDLSDAPEELRQSVIKTYEALLQKKPEDWSEVEKVRMEKLQPIVSALGYVPQREPVSSTARLVLPQPGRSAKTPAKEQGPKIHPREREASRRRLEQLFDHPHWLVTEPEMKAGKPVTDEGIAIRVHPWYERGKKSGRLLGFRILDGYASPWLKTDLAVGDVIRVDRDYKIVSTTLGGQEGAGAKLVPSSFNSERNATKLVNMYENDQVDLSAQKRSGFAAK